MKANADSAPRPAITSPGEADRNLPASPGGGEPDGRDRGANAVSGDQGAARMQLHGDADAVTGPDTEEPRRVPPRRARNRRADPRRDGIGRYKAPETTGDLD